MWVASTLVANTLTIPAANVLAGADFRCTFTNSKNTTLTLTKISSGAVGAFSFTGNNGLGNQTITTITSGVGFSGTTQTLTVAGASTTVTETTPSGYTVTDIACTGLGAGGAVIKNLATGTMTLDAAATVAGSNISCTYTNTFVSNFTIQGKVFFDNGKGTATPHNGIQETGELGIGNIPMTATEKWKCIMRLKSPKRMIAARRSSVLTKDLPKH